MEYQAQAEHIANGIILSLHIFDVDYFRSHIARGTAPNEKILISVCELGQTEISYDAFSASRISEDQILRFEISVHYLFAVHFLESTQNGKNDLFGLLWSKLLF